MDIDTEQTNNWIFLRGKLAQPPIERELPSGDTILSFRLTVERPAGERAKVDSLECAAVRPRVRRTLGRAEPGDLLEIEGSLHRRFWRGATGTASRYEVRVDVARVTSGRRSGASKARTLASA